MTRTENVDRLLREVIEGENLDVILKALSPADQNLLYDLVAELREGGDGVLDGLWHLDYVRKPPSMEEFISDPYWLGNTCLPDEDAETPGLFPAWREILTRDLNLDSRIHNLVLTGSLGSGKCLRKGTRVRMADGGVKLAEDILQGDQVMGDDGTPRNVLNLARGQDQMYTIQPTRPKNMPPWGCTADHLLVLKRYRGSRRSGTWHEVHEEVRAEDVYNNWQTHRYHRLVRTGYELTEVPVPVDPYWLGTWMGDGHADAPRLTISLEDPEIAEYNDWYAKSLGLKVTITANKSSDQVFVHSPADIRGKCGNPKNILLDKMKSLGLCVKTGSGYSKFIPEVYLKNSKKVRMELLAGLLDTDGNKQVNGGYEIAQSRFELAMQIKDLAESLGFSCDFSEKIIHSPKFEFPCVAYRLYIGGAYDVPVRVARKQSDQPVATRAGGNRRCAQVTGFTISKDGVEDYYGFELGGNHRFLLADGTITHNSTVAALIVCYRIALCRLLRNPFAFLNMMKDTPIVFAMLSVTRASVMGTIFAYAMQHMSLSPFFKEVCNFDPTRKYADMAIPLGNQLSLIGGSQGQHVLGRNTLGIAMDEGNFRREKNPDMKAYALYDEIRHRITNRFQKTAGYLPAICILASSARDESSFTEQVITDINKVNDPRTQRVYRLSAYEVKRKHLSLQDRWFKVAFGLKTQAPKILLGWYKEDGTPLEDAAELETAPQGAKVRLVPEDYMAEFQRNTTTSLQSICGESTGGSFRLFGDFSIVEDAITEGDRSNLKNPCTLDRVPMSNRNNQELWDYLDHKLLVQKQLGRFIPLRDPGAPRFAHYDLATKSQAAVAICHAAGRRLVDGIYDADSGRTLSQYRPIIEYDLLLAIVAEPQSEISLIKIQNIIFWLRDRCGYQFGLVTADQFQCLDGDTLVNTARGIVPISTIQSGDVVMSKSGPKRVTNIVSYQDAPRIKITTRGGQIVGTPNHRLWGAKPHYIGNSVHLSKSTLTPTWLRLDELSPGDVLYSSPGGCVDADKEVLLPPLSPVHRGSHRVRHTSRWNPPSTLTPEFAQWLGLYWVKGWASSHKPKNKKHNYSTIGIASHNQDVPDLIAAWNLLDWYPRLAKYPDRNSSATISASTRLYRWLVECGFKKSPQKGKHPGLEVGIPELIMRSPTAVKAAFLRGLFSADGSVGRWGEITLSCKHLRMVRTIQVMLQSCWGMPSRITILRRSFKKGGPIFVGYVICLRGPKQLFLDKIGFCYSRQTLKAQQQAYRPGRNLFNHVKSIEHLPPGTVYDITVEDDPSYTANGFISHNSSLALQLLESKGFKTKPFSVDRTKEPYYAWRDGFQEGLIRLFRHTVLMSEAENLLDLDKKIDHPTHGGKDVTDAAVGAYYSAMQLGIGAVGGADDIIPNLYSEGPQGGPPSLELKLPTETLPKHSFEA